MRRDAEFYGDVDLDLIYIAKKLKEALKLEEQLTTEGIDYLVETDTYSGGIIFRSQRVGVFFYVLPENVEVARAVLLKHGHRPYEATDG